MDVVTVLKLANETVTPERWFKGRGGAAPGRGVPPVAPVELGPDRVPMCAGNAIIWAGGFRPRVIGSIIEQASWWAASQEAAYTFLKANDLLDDPRFAFPILFKEYVKAVVWWNNDRDTTYEDVKLAFKRAIYHAEEAA